MIYSFPYDGASDETQSNSSAKRNPKKRTFVDQPIEKKAEKPIKPKLFATEVKSEKFVREPRAKLNADSLLSELSQLKG